MDKILNIFEDGVSHSYKPMLHIDVYSSLSHSDVHVVCCVYPHYLIYLTSANHKPMTSPSDICTYQFLQSFTKVDISWNVVYVDSDHRDSQHFVACSRYFYHHLVTDVWTSFCLSMCRYITFKWSMDVEKLGLYVNYCNWLFTQNKNLPRIFSK